MKYSILGFNQQAVLNLSEDITTDDLLLLNYIYEAVASPSMKHLVSNDIAYVWLQHKKILEDLPILNIGEDSLKRRLKKLSDLNLIASKQVFDEKLGFFSCTVPTFEQILLAELISSGDFERHINRVRRNKRREMLTSQK